MKTNLMEKQNVERTGDVMGALAVIGIIYIIFKLIQEACEVPYESGSLNNTTLYSHDIDKVVLGEMTSKQLDKNVRAGKYR